MKSKLTLGWLFIVVGTLFLICGLVVMIFATIQMDSNGSLVGEIPDLSFWPALANALMKFVIELLNVQWTTARVGAFLILVGLILDGGGAYFIKSSSPR
jgi:hypothetical protein